MSSLSSGVVTLITSKLLINSIKLSAIIEIFSQSYQLKENPYLEKAFAKPLILFHGSTIYTLPKLLSLTPIQILFPPEQSIIGIMLDGIHPLKFSISLTPATALPFLYSGTILSVILLTISAEMSIP